MQSSSVRKENGNDLWTTILTVRGKCILKIFDPSFVPRKKTFCPIICSTPPLGNGQFVEYFGQGARKSHSKDAAAYQYLYINGFIVQNPYGG